MDDMIYVAMAGAKQTALAQATNSNNLANASTPGFRADLDAFASLPVYGPTYPRAGVCQRRARRRRPELRRHHQHRARSRRRHQRRRLPRRCRRPMAARPTPAPATFASPPRACSPPAPAIRCSATAGRLRCRPSSASQIGADGTISILPLGQSGGTLAVVDRLKLVNPDPATASASARRPARHRRRRPRPMPPCAWRAVRSSPAT